MENKTITRKDFIKYVGAASVASIALLKSGCDLKTTRIPKKREIENPLKNIPDNIIKDNVLLTMQKELQEAIKKPKNEIHWAMVIDLRKCVGCHACTVACQAENVLPPGVIYRKVREEEFGKYPNVGRRFVPRLCMHCDKTLCISVCPVRATYKDEDGIVVIDYEKCIGCRYCIVGCPYGVRASDNGKFYTDDTPKEQEYEKRANFEYGKKWARRKRLLPIGGSPIGNARKCHFCKHRIYKGLLPACVITCIGKATYFGDLNNKGTTVAKLFSLPNSQVMYPHYNTKPNVYYLM